MANNANQIPYGQPRHDKLFKVRSLLDIIVPCFAAECEIHKECTVDEAMIPFKGRLGMKQYMKDKPTKWGIKVFVLADAHNGYVKNIQVYTGKNVENDGNNIGLCTKVVLDLLDDIDSAGLQLYTDNYYTSPVLFQHLYAKKQINACGTCRPNRKGFPSQIITKPTVSNRGQCNHRSNGPLLACSWVDKRALYLISTIHVAQVSGGSTVLRTEKDGSRIERQCPPCVIDYQKFMGGVDRGDQLESYYNMGRRTKKWWRRVVFYLFEVCILNAFVLEGYVQPELHANKGRKKRDILSFRLELAHELISGFFPCEKAGRSRSEESAQLKRLNNTLPHWPQVTQKKGNCVVCLEKRRRKRLPTVGHRHETKFMCKSCDAYLCITSERNCFQDYHTLVHFAV